MALAFAQKHRWVDGDRLSTVVEVTFDSSYTTGGKAVTPANFGLGLRIDHIESNQAPGGKTVTFDPANSKLLVFSGATEASNASDQSAVIVRLHSFGK